MHRREFIVTGTAAAAALGARRGLSGEAGRSRRVGLIGCGWYGKTSLFRLIQVEPVEVVALCDVDSHMLEDAARQVADRQRSGNTPRTYGDFRVMLAENKLEIVIVATPDHWHALTAIEALKSGAHVYLEKPTSVDVAESLAILSTARTLGRVVQVNLQRRSTPHLIEAREQIVRGGVLGRIGHVDICSYYHMRSRENPPDTEPPANLDYDFWTGPAPMRPYNALVHPRRWRSFMEYSNGVVGDMCVHMLDMVRWMLGLGWPRRISSSGGIRVQRGAKANTTDTQTATFEFEDLTVHWTHRTWGTPRDPDYPWAAFLHGEKGTLKASVFRYDFVPDKEGEPLHRDVVYELDEYPEDRTEKALEKHVAPAIRTHMRDFLACIDERGGRRPVSDIEQGVISSVSCILANLSMRLGRSLEWDPATQSVRNDPEANALLRRPYRAPWQHPADGLPSA